MCKKYILIYLLLLITLHFHSLNIKTKNKNVPYDITGKNYIYHIEYKDQKPHSDKMLKEIQCKNKSGKIIWNFLAGENDPIMPLNGILYVGIGTTLTCIDEETGIVVEYISLPLPILKMDIKDDSPLITCYTDTSDGLHLHNWSISLEDLSKNPFPAPGDSINAFKVGILYKDPISLKSGWRIFQNKKGHVTIADTEVSKEDAVKWINVLNDYSKRDKLNPYIPLRLGLYYLLLGRQSEGNIEFSKALKNPNLTIFMAISTAKYLFTLGEDKLAMEFLAECYKHIYREREFGYFRYDVLIQVNLYGIGRYFNTNNREREFFDILSEFYERFPFYEASISELKGLIKYSEKIHNRKAMNIFKTALSFRKYSNCISWKNIVSIEFARFFIEMITLILLFAFLSWISTKKRKSFYILFIMIYIFIRLSFHIYDIKSFNFINVSEMNESLQRGEIWNPMVERMIIENGENKSQPEGLTLLFQHYLSREEWDKCEMLENKLPNTIPANIAKDIFHKFLKKEYLKDYLDKENLRVSSLAYHISRFNESIEWNENTNLPFFLVKYREANPEGFLLMPLNCKQINKLFLTINKSKYDSLQLLVSSFIITDALLLLFLFWPVVSFYFIRRIEVNKTGIFKKYVIYYLARIYVILFPGTLQTIKRSFNHFLIGTVALGGLISSLLAFQVGWIVSAIGWVNSCYFPFLEEYIVDKLKFTTLFPAQFIFTFGCIVLYVFFFLYNLVDIKYNKYY